MMDLFKIKPCKKGKAKGMFSMKIAKKLFFGRQTGKKNPQAVGISGLAGLVFCHRMLCYGAIF